MDPPDARRRGLGRRLEMGRPAGQPGEHVGRRVLEGPRPRPEAPRRSRDSLRRREAPQIGVERARKVVIEPVGRAQSLVCAFERCFREDQRVDQTAALEGRLTIVRRRPAGDLFVIEEVDVDRGEGALRRLDRALPRVAADHEHPFQPLGLEVEIDHAARHVLHGAGELLVGLPHIRTRSHLDRRQRRHLAANADEAAARLVERVELGVGVEHLERRDDRAAEGAEHDRDGLRRPDQDGRRRGRADDERYQLPLFPERPERLARGRVGLVDPRNFCRQLLERQVPRRRREHRMHAAVVEEIAADGRHDERGGPEEHDADGLGSRILRHSASAPCPRQAIMSARRQDGRSDGILNPTEGMARSDVV